MKLKLKKLKKKKKKERKGIFHVKKVGANIEKKYRRDFHGKILNKSNKKIENHKF